MCRWGDASPSSPLWIRHCLGELCVRPVETLLISRRVNAGKFCTWMTLLLYQLPVEWCRYQYSKLINEFLAIFFTVPTLSKMLSECWSHVSSRCSDWRVWDWQMAPAGGQWVHAINNPQSTSRIGARVSLCSTSWRDKRTQSQNLQNCLARRQWTLFCVVNFLCKILCLIIMSRRLSVTRYRYNAAQ